MVKSTDLLNMERTTTKIRKTFRYPTDNDEDDSLPEALDEEEQENLIRNLNEENTKLNLLYSHILLALPLLSLIPYIPSLFSPHTKLLSLLSITSLLSTAYLLFTLAPGITGIQILDRLNTSSDAPPRSRKQKLHHPIQDGPIRQFLPYLNLGLCVVLVLLGKTVARKSEAEVWWGFGWLPAGVWVVVAVAKLVMGGVDPEGELGGLRYGFKGV